MKLSLSRMLFLIGVLFVVLLLSCAVLVGAMLGKTASDNDLELRRTLLQNSAAQVSYEIIGVTESVRTLALRETVQNFVEGTPLEKYHMLSELRNTFNNFVQFMDPIVHLRLRLVGGQTLGSNTYSGEFVPEYAAYAKLVDMLDLDNFCTGSKRTAILRTECDALLAIAVPVENTMRQRMGAMVVICSVNNLAAHMMEDTPYLIESGGEMLYASAPTLVSAWSAQKDTVSLDGSVYSTLSQPIRETDWALVSIYRPTPWYDFLLPGSSALWICLLAAALVVFSLWFIYQKIVEPIENLAVQIDSVTASDDFVTNHYSDRNELTRLAQGVNAMNSRIRRLNEDVLRKTQQLYQMKLVQMSERILLLQSQLNPHFLYNNLECIRGMAYMHDVDGVRDMTVHMAKIYRYCIRGGQSTVGAEVECVLSYLNIIELRYGPVYSVHCRIPPELNEIQCPRMLLQPLVENSVLHGFVREKRHAGSIVITAYKQGSVLRFMVEDDGIGMDAEKMRRMNDDFELGVTEESDGWNDRVGLYNVNYRLKLIGRSGSGVRLTQGRAGGLCVILSLAKEN